MVEKKSSSDFEGEPILELGKRYTKDLEILDSLNVPIITNDDITKLMVIAVSYGIKHKIKMSNFYEILAKVRKEAFMRAERYGEAALGKEIELTPGRLPKAPRKSKSKVPEELQEETNETIEE